MRSEGSEQPRNRADGWEDPPILDEDEDGPEIADAFDPRADLHAFACGDEHAFERIFERMQVQLEQVVAGTDEAEAWFADLFTGTDQAYPVPEDLDLDELKRVFRRALQKGIAKESFNLRLLFLRVFADEWNSPKRGELTLAPEIPHAPAMTDREHESGSPESPQKIGTSLREAVLPAIPSPEKAIGRLKLVISPHRRATKAIFEKFLDEVKGKRWTKEQNLEFAESLTQVAANSGFRLACSIEKLVIPVSIAHRDGVFVLTTEKGRIPGKSSGYVGSSPEFPELTVLPRAPRTSKRLEKGTEVKKKSD